MSSNSYVLKLAIDPSNLFGGSIPGMGSKDASNKPTSALDLIFGSGTKDKLKGLAKLGIISVGVGAILNIVKGIASKFADVSPVFGVMLKLFNTAIVFLLRPIADFFGFFLRPILVYFLRNVALPFYKYFQPLAQSLGTFFGTQAINNVAENPTGATVGGATGAIGGAIGGAKLGAILGTLVLPGIGTAIGTIGGAIVGGVSGGLLGVNLGALIEGWWKSITGEVEPAVTDLTEEVDSASDLFGLVPTAYADVPLATSDLADKVQVAADLFGKANTGLESTDLPTTLNNVDNALSDAATIVIDSGGDINTKFNEFGEDLGTDLTNTRTRFGINLNDIDNLGTSLKGAFQGIVSGLSYIESEINKGVEEFVQKAQEFFTPYTQEELDEIRNNPKGGRTPGSISPRGNNRRQPKTVLDVNLVQSDTGITNTTSLHIGEHKAAKVMLEELQ